MTAAQPASTMAGPRTRYPNRRNRPLRIPNRVRCRQQPLVTALLLLAIVISAPGIARAQAEAVDLLKRPDPEGAPTNVEVVASLREIADINGAAQSFTALFTLMLRWSDPRLAGAVGTDRTIAMSDAWHPKLIIENRRDVSQTLPEELMIGPHGVQYIQRYWGEFSNPLNLRDFPIDQHTFEFRVLIIQPETEARFAEVPGTKLRSALSNVQALADWTVKDWGTRIETYQPDVGYPPVSRFVFHFTAKRKLGFYMVQMLIPLTLIVMMSWIVFWLAPSESGTQIDVAITAVLTLIAYRFAIGNHLPNISYLTRMDLFLMGSTFLVFGALMEAALTSRFAQSGKEGFIVTMDLWSRILFPLGFLVLVIFAFVL